MQYGTERRAALAELASTSPTMMIVWWKFPPCDCDETKQARSPHGDKVQFTYDLSSMMSSFATRLLWPFLPQCTDCCDLSPKGRVAGWIKYLRTVGGEKNRAIFTRHPAWDSSKLAACTHTFTCTGRSFSFNNGVEGGGKAYCKRRWNLIGTALQRFPSFRIFLQSDLNVYL